jgi:hypothetical protein
MAPLAGKFLPDQDGAGLPMLVSIVAAVVLVLVVAVVTFAAFEVNAGAVAEEPVGNVQVARICPGTQADALETFKVSEAELPVFTEVLMRRLLVVLG